MSQGGKSADCYKNVVRFSLYWVSAVDAQSSKLLLFLAPSEAAAAY